LDSKFSALGFWGDSLLGNKVTTGSPGVVGYGLENIPSHIFNMVFKKPTGCKYMCNYLVSQNIFSQSENRE